MRISFVHDWDVDVITDEAIAGLVGQVTRDGFTVVAAERDGDSPHRMRLTMEGPAYTPRPSHSWPARR